MPGIRRALKAYHWRGFRGEWHTQATAILNPCASCQKCSRRVSAGLGFPIHGMNADSWRSCMQEPLLPQVRRQILQKLQSSELSALILSLPGVSWHSPSGNHGRTLAFICQPVQACCMIAAKAAGDTEPQEMLVLICELKRALRLRGVERRREDSRPRQGFFRCHSGLAALTEIPCLRNRRYVQRVRSCVLICRPTNTSPALPLSFHSDPCGWTMAVRILIVMIILW